MPAEDRSVDLDSSSSFSRQFAAAREQARYIRLALLARPQVARRIHRLPFEHLVHHPDSAADAGPDRAGDPILALTPISAESETGDIRISRRELDRLKGLVGTLTTALGELNLWLANAGHEPIEVPS